MVRFVTQSSGTYRDVPRGDDAVITRAANAEKHTMAMMNQHATSMATGGRGCVGGNTHAIIPLPPSVDRRFEKHDADNAQQLLQQRGDPAAPTTNKSALTKVQNYIMASRLARHQEEMQKALQAQQQSHVRPPRPPPPPTHLRKQRVITPEMVARRPVESKHNIMMRSQHKTSNDSVSNSVVSDSTDQIENTKKAVAQRKRDDKHHRSMMEKKANAGASTPAALAQLVAALSVNNGSNRTPKDDNKSISTTVTKNTFSSSSVSTKNKASLLATEEFKRSMSTTSDVSKSSIITEPELIRKTSSSRIKLDCPEDNKNSFDSKANGVNGATNSKANNLIPKKTESPKVSASSIDSKANGVNGATNNKANNPKVNECSIDSKANGVNGATNSKANNLIPKKTESPKDNESSIDSQADGVNGTISSQANNLIPKETESPNELARLTKDSDAKSVALSHPLLSTKSDLSKDSLITEAEIVLQLPQEKNKSTGSQADGVNGYISNNADNIIPKKKELQKGSEKLLVDTKLQPAQPSSVFSPVSKEDIETQLPLLSPEAQVLVQAVVNTKPKYVADNSEDEKESDAIDDSLEESEASPEVSSLGSAKLLGEGDNIKEKNPMKLDTKYDKKINLNMIPPGKPRAKKMGKSDTTPSKRSTLLGKNSKDSKKTITKKSSMLGKKSKLIEEERDEEEDEYLVDVDDDTRDEQEETNQVQLLSTTPPKRSTLLGKNSKDSKKTITKKSSMLGKKSKLIEEERDEEEDEYLVDVDDDVRDEQVETNPVQRQSTTPPKRSTLLGKNSKDSKKRITKKSSLLGKKSKLIEEERDYTAEEGEEYLVDIDDDTRDEQEETNQVQRHSTAPPKRSTPLGKNSKDSKKTITKKSSMLGMKSKVIEEERDYSAEEEDEYRVYEDDDTRDEQEETNQVQRHSTTPPKRSTLLGKNSKDSKKTITKKSSLLGKKSKLIEEERDEEEDEYLVDIDDDTRDEQEETNQVQRHSKAPPKRSTPLGKNSKDSKKTITKKSTLLGKKSKVIEEEREYTAEEEDEYLVDVDDDVRDEQVETNPVQRHEEESYSDSFSASMKSTLSRAEYISVESSITTDREAFVQKAGVLKRTASLVRNPGRTLFNRARSKAEKEGEELAKSMRHGMTAARADNRKSEHPFKYDDCTPDIEEIDNGNTITILDNHNILSNNLTSDGNSMYEDNTDFIPKTVAAKFRGAINSGIQTQMNENELNFPIIRNASSGIRELSSFQSLKETATQTSNDRYIAPIFSPTNSPTQQAIRDDFVLPSYTDGPNIVPSSTAGPNVVKSEAGTISHLMESFALCGAKVCMGTSNAMLSCADSCGDDPPGRMKTVLPLRYDVAPSHTVRQSASPTMAAQRCANIPSCYNNNADHPPSSNNNNTDREVAGIFTRAFAMALNGLNNGTSDTKTTKERESPMDDEQADHGVLRKQQYTKAPHKVDKLDDFLSIDGMFMSPDRHHERLLMSVPQKIAVKPKKRRHTAEINDVKHSTAETARKPKKRVQMCEDEMKNCVSWSDQIDNLQDLTRTNSLTRASSNGSKTGKSKRFRELFNRIGKMRIGFTYEV